MGKCKRDLGQDGTIILWMSLIWRAVRIYLAQDRDHWWALVSAVMNIVTHMSIAK
jgi:hypothetical protein